MGIWTAAIALSLTFASASGSATLSEGIRRYKAQDYGGALASLSSSLTQQITPKQRARAHVYLGLIQCQYERHKDARRSFAEAMEHDAQVRLPASAPKDARIMFRRAKRKHTKRVQRLKRRQRQKQKQTDPPEVVPEPEVRVDPTKPPDLPPPTEAAPVETKDPVKTPNPTEPAAVVAPPPPPPVMQSTPEPPPLVVTDPEPQEGPNIVGWSLVGVGGASAIVGAVFAGLTASAQSRADDIIAKDGFAIEYADAISDRNRNLTVSVSGFAAAAVSAGIGAVLLATD